MFSFLILLQDHMTKGTTLSSSVAIYTVVVEIKWSPFVT